MTAAVSPRWQRSLAASLVLSGLGSLGSACDRRFEFDTQPAQAGAGGGNAGVTSGGAALGGSSGGTDGASGAGARGGASAGVAGGGTAGSGGGSSTTCGSLSECSADTHCADGECVQCADDDDCAAYGLARCEPARHRCVACLVTTDCPDGFACDSLANRCLQTCADDKSCPEDAHGCDERRKVCYECDEDRECATSTRGHLCASDGSGCVQCRKDADCSEQYCDQLSGRCVECRDGGDCPSRICNPVTFGCQP